MGLTLSLISSWEITDKSHPAMLHGDAEVGVKLLLMKGEREDEEEEKRGREKKKKKRRMGWWLTLQ